MRSSASTAAEATPADNLRRLEAGFAWIERTVKALDDTKLENTIYHTNKSLALVRLHAVRNEVLFLYHALGIRDELP